MAGVKRLRHQRFPAQEKQLPEAGVGRWDVGQAITGLNESPGILLLRFYIQRARGDDATRTRITQVNEVPSVGEKPWHRMCHVSMRCIESRKGRRNATRRGDPH